MGKEHVLQPSIGSGLTINVTAGLPSGLHLEDVNFTCEFYSSTRVSSKVKTINLSKEQMIKVDADNYIAVLDSKILGSGTVMLKLSVDIPDDNFPEGIRPEVVRFSTGVNVVV